MGSRYSGPAGLRRSRVIAIPRPDNTPGLFLRRDVPNGDAGLELLAEERKTHPRAQIFTLTETYTAEDA